jgi:hypothetical protein
LAIKNIEYPETVFANEQDRYTGAFVISPSDSTELSNVKAIYFNAAGDARIELVDGGDVVFKGINTGDLLPIAAKKFYLSGGTSSAHTTTRPIALT